MKLSVIIPAYNESLSIKDTLEEINSVLISSKIDFELLVINDNSLDNTVAVIEEAMNTMPNLTYKTNYGPNGFGYAVRYGLESFSGDCVAIMMGDLSDSPYDLIKFYKKMVEGNYDCVYGSRFIKNGKVEDYPWLKRIINRMANLIIRMVMNIKYNDTTNAFKLYKRETIDGLKPFLAPHFNLTIELPLKAIIRGYTYTVLPNSWKNRKQGESKLKIREMGSRYFFILMYCFIEKFFSKGDFNKKW
ncbi:dolichol-phosphate mannosyltransferase [Flavobacteriaceae bacterium MAR_2010_188]|nr:dolichol-phosphate mannosyltransferase [Flavobacteriaceae bacterium MAR_2010_188]